MWFFKFLYEFLFAYNRPTRRPDATISAVVNFPRKVMGLPFEQSTNENRYKLGHCARGFPQTVWVFSTDADVPKFCQR